MKFCVNVYINNHKSFVEFQGQRSQDQIFGFFAIVRSSEKVVYTITHKSHEHVFTITTGINPLNINVIGQRSGSFFILCLIDCVYVICY